MQAWTATPAASGAPPAEVAESPNPFTPTLFPSRARHVRVLDEDKQSIGVLPTREALSLAEERDVDLIMIVPEASPPVCRYAALF
jgi:Translation initiation factor IF-3, N-terminal domain